MSGLEVGILQPDQLSAADTHTTVASCSQCVSQLHAIRHVGVFVRSLTALFMGYRSSELWLLWFRHVSIAMYSSDSMGLANCLIVHGGAELIAHIKKKRRRRSSKSQSQQDFEEKQLQDSLHTGETQVAQRFEAQIRELGDIVRIGDGASFHTHAHEVRCARPEADSHPL